MVVSLLVGCGTGVPLSEVEILGGSVEATAVVRQELEAFDRATGEGRLWLREVRFTDDLAERGIGGMVRGSPAIVLLDASNPLPVLHRVVRHELCHALDYSEDLAHDGSPLLDRLADGLFASGAYTPDIERRNARTRRSEAMAAFCERGAVLAQSLAGGECDDPVDAVAMARWLLDEVWTGELPDSVGRSEEPVAWWDAGYPLDGQLNLRATTDPGVVKVAVSTAADEWDWSEHFVDLLTGEEVPRYLSPVEVCCPPIDVYWYGFIAETWVGTPDVGAAVGRIGLAHLGASSERLLWFDGEWHAVVGCVRTEEDVLMVQDEAWTGWIEGSTVAWGPLLGSP